MSETRPTRGAVCKHGVAGGCAVCKPCEHCGCLLASHFLRFDEETPGPPQGCLMHPSCPGYFVQTELSTQLQDFFDDRQAKLRAARAAIAYLYGVIWGADALRAAPMPARESTLTDAEWDEAYDRWWHEYASESALKDTYAARIAIFAWRQIADVIGDGQGPPDFAE